MADPRQMRVCDVCGGVDDHPRHVVALVPDGFPGAVPAPELVRAAIEAGAPDQALVDLLDHTSVCRHMDCCAATGCEVCAGQIADAGGATGLLLVAHIESKAEVT